MLDSKLSSPQSGPQSALEKSGIAAKTRRIMTAALALGLSMSTTSASARPMPMSKLEDDTVTEPEAPKARCYTGEFIFGDSQIEMVGCTRDQSQLLFLKVGELFAVPRINPEYNLLVKPGPQPAVCALRPGEKLTADMCWPMFPVYHTRAGSAAVVPTMKGKFVTGRAFSFLNKDDQIEGEKKREAR